MLEAIVGGTELGLVVLDGAGRAQYMNASARRLLGADGALPQRARRFVGPMRDHVRATGEPRVARAPRIEDVELRPPRLEPPGTLAAICSGSTFDRASHTYGKSYRDVVRGARGVFEHPPDLVAFPRDEEDVASILDWCASADAAAIPYGGGSSVVGGVEPRVGDRARRVRGPAKEIHDEYVSPPAATDFGIMCLATEGLYAEVLRQPGLVSEVQQRYRVVPAGPTTLAAKKPTRR